MRRAIRVLGALAGALLPCAARAQVARTAPLPIPRTIEELRAEIQKVVDSTKVPGVGFAVFTKDSLLYAGGAGYADVAARKAVDGDTHFRTGSVSKSFVATALLMLQRAGRIDLNAKLRDIAPEVPFENRWEETDPVRVVHLLEHTAGFDDMHFRAVYNLRDKPDVPLRAALERSRSSLVSRWRPGERFSYSNPGYGVAGYLIEKVSGIPFDRFIKDSILTPLGMSTSAFGIAEEAKPLMAQGYGAASEPPLGFPAIYLRPAGDLQASPRELSRFVQMLMRRGSTSDGRRLLDSASVDRMERVGSTLAAERGLALGYGLGNYAALDLPVPMQGHDGGIEGFISSYRYSADADVGFVALVNSVASVEALEKVQRLLVAYALGDTTRHTPPAVTVPASTLAEYVGHYKDVAPRNQLLALVTTMGNQMTVSLRGDTLFAKGTSDIAVRLIPVSDSTFRRPNEAGPTLGFFHDRDGDRVLTGTRYMQRTSPWPQRLAMGGLFAAVALFGSAVLAALLWVPRAIFGKKRNAAANRLRTRVLLAVLAIVVFAALVVTADFKTVGVVGTRSIAIFAVSLLVPVLAIVALASAWRTPRAAAGTAVNVHSLLVALAVLGVTVLLAVNGFIGIRTWAY